MRQPGPPSERSIITVLSVDMVDSTPHIAACEPDDAQAFFDRWFDYISGVVERHGGLLVSFGGDGGIAVFGWPSPLEDHADRACAAAWDIQHREAGGLGPDGTPVHFRVGVHSGLVGLRHVRRRGWARFDTAGATVNIAAKLQQLAPPDGILVSAEAVRLCHSQLELTSHAGLEILGLADTGAFKLNDRPAEAATDVARRYRSPMVGRRDELERLTKHLRRQGGACVSIAVIGEAGVGKSRLAAATLADVAEADARVLVFYGDPQKRTTPFAAARFFITDLLQLHGATSPERVQAAIVASPLDADDASAIRTLLAAPPTSGRGRVGLTQTQIARALARAFVSLAEGHPHVLLVEDLHLVDLESRQFLRLLARGKTGAPLSLLVTGRPEAMRDAREVAGAVVRLEPMPRPDMEDLARQLWRAGDLPRWLLDRVVERADGLPFVLEELINSVEAEDGAGYQPLPHRVESVIHARLHRLSRSAKALAQALSLLGEEISLEFARVVVGCDMSALLDDLSELERFAFIHPISGHATRFRHQIIAEALADTIPRDRRRAFHRAASDAITALHANLDGRYEQLAFHAEGAGEDGQALGYLLEAGLEARRNSAYASLNLIFDRAVGIAERMGDQADETYVDLVLMACASLVQLGEFEKMNAHLPRTMELARRHDRPKKVCSAMCHLGLICWFEGRYAEGLRTTEEGLAMARSLESPPLIFAHNQTLANILHDMGQIDRAIEIQRDLCEMLTGKLEAARLGATAHPRSMALSFLGWFMPEAGRYAEGIEWAKQGLAVAERERDAYAEILARSSLARNLQMLDRNTEAVACLEVARSLADATGHDAIKANLTGRIAISLSRIGRAREAVSIVETYLRSQLHLRAGKMEVYYLYAGYAEALIGCGETERGFEALATALGIARRINNPSLIIDALGLGARLRSGLSPGDQRIDTDLREQQALAERFGLPLWQAGEPAEEPPRRVGRAAE